MDTSDLLQNLRDSGGHDKYPAIQRDSGGDVRSPTESEGLLWSCTSNLLQNLRDIDGHVRSPTESEGYRWSRQISYRIGQIAVVTSDLSQNQRDSGGHIMSPTEYEGYQWTCHINYRI